MHNMILSDFGAYTWEGGHSAAVVLDGGGHIGQSLNGVDDHDDAVCIRISGLFGAIRMKMGL